MTNWSLSGFWVGVENEELSDVSHLSRRGERQQLPHLFVAGSRRPRVVDRDECADAHGIHTLQFGTLPEGLHGVAERVADWELRPGWRVVVPEAMVVECRDRGFGELRGRRGDRESGRRITRYAGRRARVAGRGRALGGSTCGSRRSRATPASIRGGSWRHQRDQQEQMGHDGENRQHARESDERREPA